MGFYETFRALQAAERALFANYLAVFYPGYKIAASICAFSDASTEEVLDLNVLFRHVSGKPEAPNAKEKLNLQNNLSDLKKWLLEFLTFQEMKNSWDEPDVQALTLEALRRRRLFPLYARQTAKARRDIANYPERTLWDFSGKLRVAHHVYFHATNDTWTQRGDELENLFDLLDHFYGAARLVYMSEMLSRQRIIGESAGRFDPEKTGVFAQVLKKKDQAPLSVYRSIFQLVDQRNAQDYQALKSVFFEDPPPGKDEQLALLHALLNFTAFAIQDGQSAYVQESFDLYKRGVEQALFTINGFFAVGSFNNIVNLACALKEFVWVKSFVEKWTPLLDPQEKTDTQNLAAARILFHEGEYKKAQVKINDVPHSNIYYVLQSRLLLIQCVFELGQPKSFILAQCDNLQKIAKRHKSLGDKHREGALGFLNVMRAILAGKPKSALSNILESQSSVFAKSWLISKINRLSD